MISTPGGLIDASRYGSVVRSISSVLSLKCGWTGEQTEVWTYGYTTDRPSCGDAGEPSENRHYADTLGLDFVFLIFSVSIVS